MLNTTAGAGSQRGDPQGLAVHQPGWVWDCAVPVAVLIVDSMMSSVKAKEFWFTLTSDTLTWYKDDEEKEVKYQLPLDGVRVVEAEDTGMFKRKFTFCLVHPMKKAIFKVRHRAKCHHVVLSAGSGPQVAGPNGHQPGREGVVAGGTAARGRAHARICMQCIWLLTEPDQAVYAFIIYV